MHSFVQSLLYLMILRNSQTFHECKWKEVVYRREVCILMSLSVTWAGHAFNKKCEEICRILKITATEASCERVGLHGWEHHRPLVTLQWTYISTLHVAASLAYCPTFYCHPGMKEIKQDATVPGSNQTRYDIRLDWYFHMLLYVFSWLLSVHA